MRSYKRAVLVLTAILLVLLAGPALTADKEGGDAGTDSQDGGSGPDGGGDAGSGEGDVAGAEAPTTVLATPEEFRSYMEAEKANIEREREALLALRAEVKKEVDHLTQLQAQLDKRMTEIDEERAAKVKKLVKIYAAMAPEEVKPLISKLDEDLMLNVLYQMKPKDQAAIMALFTPDEAAKISEKILKKKF